MYRKRLGKKFPQLSSWILDAAFAESGGEYAAAVCLIRKDLATKAGTSSSPSSPPNTSSPLSTPEALKQKKSKSRSRKGSNGRGKGPFISTDGGMFKILLGGLLLVFNAGSTVVNQMALAESGGTMTWSPAISAATTEAFKLVVAAVFLCHALVQQRSAIGSKQQSAKQPVNMPMGFVFCIRYAVPGLLYALSNVLTYTAVELVGSTNYQLLNNIKIITTAVIYRAVLNRRLKVYQWVALCVLFIAMCTLGLTKSSEEQHTMGEMFAGSALMLFIAVISAAAGVYNEVLVKGTQASVWWQNVLLYSFTFSFCLIGNLLHATAGPIEAGGGIFAGFSSYVWIVIFMKAFYGQVVSLVFKYASNILKVYANSLSVIASAVLCCFMLGTPLAPVHFVAGCLIALATAQYYAKPESFAMDDADAVGCGRCGRIRDSPSEGSEAGVWR